MSRLIALCPPQWWSVLMVRNALSVVATSTVLLMLSTPLAAAQTVEQDVDTGLVAVCLGVSTFSGGDYVGAYTTFSRCDAPVVPCVPTCSPAYEGPIDGDNMPGRITFREVGARAGPLGFCVYVDTDEGTWGLDPNDYCGMNAFVCQKLQRVDCENIAPESANLGALLA